jgi:hypothetical protein
MPRRSENRRLRRLTAHLAAAAKTEHVAKTECASEPPSSLRSTPVGPLTHEQRASYERDGFLIVRQFWDPAELAPLHEHYVEICRDAPSMVKGADARVSSLVRDINVADGAIFSQQSSDFP